MPIMEVLHEINRPVHAYRSIKQKVYSIIFLIISLILLFIGVLILSAGNFKLGLIITIVAVVVFGLSRLAKLGSKISRDYSGF
jgi:hypothetical protein